MPPKKSQKESLIILINIGGTDETEDENETSILEKSKLVSELLIQRKIFLRPKDEVGVIVMGSSKTMNRLSYKNMVEISSPQVPTWDLVKIIRDLKGTNKSADWVAGINLAIKYMKTECLDSTSSTLVLLTDFKDDPDVIEEYEMDSIVSEIRNADIKLLAIVNRPLDGDSQIELNASEEVIVNFCEKVNGQIMTLDDTIPKLMMYKDQSKTPRPWTSNMDIFDIEIPVEVYLKTSTDSILPRWRISNDSSTPAQQVPVAQHKTLVNEDKQIIPKDEIITGIRYGRKFIPFSDADKAALSYKSEPKGFMIYGFIKKESVSMDCLAGDGCYIVVPQEQWASPFYSLAKAMADAGRVAIVRRVYRQNDTPKVGVLIPQLDCPGQPWCLVYIELIFAEDRRIVEIKPIKSTVDELLEEEEEAIDDLIDAMMLMEVEDESTSEKKEAFESGSVCDVTKQYVWDKLTHRALRPGSPLPPISDFLNKFLQPPESVKYKSKPVIRSIARLFPIKTVKKRFKKRTFNDDLEVSYEDDEENIESESVTEEKADVTDIPQDMENKGEKLYQIAEPVEEASQAMGTNLDELAEGM